VIDAVLVPDGDDAWFLLYTEQRNGRGYIWRQELNQNFQLNNQSHINATQVRKRF
jgi:hypothetical protein